jgi:hypothetical protein
MAKKQTFGDKVNKKKGADEINVKVIKGFKTEDGGTKFIEQFVKVEDINSIDKIDINK